MAKMGRPVAEDPKSRKITVRVTMGQFEELKAYADQHDMTLTQVLMEGWEIIKSRKSE